LLEFDHEADLDYDTEKLQVKGEVIVPPKNGGRMPQSCSYTVHTIDAAYGKLLDGGVIKKILSTLW
jgi:hypothetical protein